jgi:hypothetical protein
MDKAIEGKGGAQYNFSYMPGGKGAELGGS